MLFYLFIFLFMFKYILLIVSVVIVYYFNFPVYFTKNDWIDIQKQTKQWNTKAILVFWDFLHIWFSSLWRNVPLIADKYWYDLIYFKYPKTYFSQDEINETVLKFLKKNKQYKKIGIMGISFWETVARNVIHYLSKYKDIKKEIMFHISISWVSVWKNIKAPSPLILNNKFLMKILLNRHFIQFDKNIIYIAWKYDKYTKYSISRHFAGTNLKEINATEEELKKHLDNWSYWFNPWLVDRFIQMYNINKINPYWLNNIPFYALYWSNESWMIFKNWKENAQYMIDKLWTGKLISVPHWWHWWLVEYPNLWWDKIDIILKKIDNK